MSRSRDASSHSRGNSPRGGRSLPITEALSQDLRSNRSAGSHLHHLSVPSTYQASDPRHRRPSYAQTELSASYLQTGYDSTGYSRAPSERFIDPHPASSALSLGTLNPESLRYSIDPNTVDFNAQQNISDPSLASRPDMSSFSFPSDPLGSVYRDPIAYQSSSRSSSMRDVTYPGADRRSTSGPSGPSTLPTLIFGGPSTAEREVARQRRRAVQDSRRQTKVRTRRTRLPSTWDAGSSEAREVGHSIDSLIASSVSSYDMGSSIGGAHYSRPESISSAQIPYLGGVPSSSAPFNELSYPSTYGLDSVNPQSMYNAPQAANLPSIANPGTSGYRSRQLSTASVTSVSEEPIRIIETRSKPQCWDHGCNGRQFSTFSNLLRHQREKSGTATKSYCPRCNAEFTRTTARNGHMQHEKCKPRSTDER